jgi:hypothetical protein
MKFSLKMICLCLEEIFLRCTFLDVEIQDLIPLFVGSVLRRRTGFCPSNCHSKIPTAHRRKYMILSILYFSSRPFINNSSFFVSYFFTPGEFKREVQSLMYASRSLIKSSICFLFKIGRLFRFLIAQERAYFHQLAYALFTLPQGRLAQY